MAPPPRVSTLTQPLARNNGALLPRKPASAFSRLLSRARTVINPSSSRAATSASALLCRPAGARAPSPAPSGLSDARGGRAPGLGAAPPSGAVILWLRADLRLHDSPALEAALARCKSGAEKGKSGSGSEGSGGGARPPRERPLLPVFVFDPSDYRSGRSGPFRARFLRAAVAELRAKLRELGSDVVVGVGAPAEVLPRLAAAVGAAAVVAAGEASFDDKRVEAAVREGLAKAKPAAGSGGEGASLELVWGGTAVAPAALPWWEARGLEGTPATFAEFFAAASSASSSSPSSSPSSSSSCSSPSELPGLPATTPADRGELPTDEELCIPLALAVACSRDGDAAGARLRGGEKAAVEALEEWVRAASSSSSSSSSASSLASALSPWLATGCLSARRALEAAEAVAAESSSSSSPPSTSSPSTSPLCLAAAARRELAWRDFFRFTTAKYSERALGAAAAAAAAASKKKKGKEERAAAAAAAAAAPRAPLFGSELLPRRKKGGEVERLWAAFSSLASSSSSPAAAAAAAAYV